MQLLISNDRGVEQVRVGRLDRVRARAAARRIDRALANGASPDAEVLTALHARRLLGMRERRRLAAGLNHAWLVAAHAHPGAVSSVVVDRRAVATAHPEIVELTTRLLSSHPVSVRGVAFVRTLLTSGTGPMYWLVPGRPLGAALRHAVELLALDSEVRV